MKGWGSLNEIVNLMISLNTAVIVHSSVLSNGDRGWYLDGCPSTPSSDHEVGIFELDNFGILMWLVGWCGK